MLAIAQPGGRLHCTFYVSIGSFSTELVWTKRSLRSAMPPIATEFTRHDESTRCATLRLEHVQQCAHQAVRLLDQLVGGGEQLRMKFEAERLGGLQIDDELIFVRLLHR
jgi:hypothetical protein